MYHIRKLNAAFSNHMKFKHKIQRAHIGHDYHPIKAAGFFMRIDHLCKTCHKKASSSGCGDHYDAKNRYKRRIIYNMKLICIQENV